ncbi:unnamed protein product [Nippostrongylus brasiliensis]|uniref:Uncharacterized protein n=1 Tax=Nippostrongylus brasiliensis TaxID=27835 RepID=A0A0N4YCY4_NIPBR|nr:unnamed protein product [Nippostrongylus brasiliensis]
MADLTEELNALGHAKRTEKQIERKIRDELKVIKKCPSGVKRELGKTGGRRVMLPRLSPAQMRAYNALQEKPRIAGMKSDDEPSPVVVDQARCFMPPQTKHLRVPPPKPVEDAQPTFVAVQPYRVSLRNPL